MIIENDVKVHINVNDINPEFCSRDCRFFIESKDTSDCKCTLAQFIEDRDSADDLYNSPSPKLIYRSKYCQNMFPVCEIRGLVKN